MASSRVSRFRPLLVLASFLAVWWLAPVAVRSFSRTSFSLFEAPAWMAYSRLKDLQDFWSLRDHSQAELIEAGRDAYRQANAAELQVQDDAALREENDRLVALLQLPPAPGFRYEFARVIRRDETTWWQQILIRKGSRDGLAPGQGVVFAGGVVGRVSKEITADQAWVELSSSSSFRVDASLGRDPNPVIFQGVETVPFHPPQGEVRNVQPNFTLPGGGPLALVTSSYGGVFPAGLTLGTVDNLLPGSDGLFQTGMVKLDPQLRNIYEVAVLVPEAPGPGTALPQLAPPAASAATKPATNPAQRPGAAR